MTTRKLKLPEYMDADPYEFREFRDLAASLKPFTTKEARLIKTVLKLKRMIDEMRAIEIKPKNQSSWLNSPLPSTKTVDTQKS